MGALDWIRRLKTDLGGSRHRRIPLGTYLVVKGDSLWRIAKRVYGDAARWEDIFLANRRIIKNPALLSPGMTLRLP